MCQKFTKMLICRYINLGKNPINDMLERFDLRALMPLWIIFILDKIICQINFKTTWHRPRRNPSLLDIFYSTCPEQIYGVGNVSTMVLK